MPQSLKISLTHTHTHTHTHTLPLREGRSAEEMWKTDWNNI